MAFSIKKGELFLIYSHSVKLKNSEGGCKLSITLLYARVSQIVIL
jgi:hypothetical protein